MRDGSGASTACGPFAGIRTTVPGVAITLDVLDLLWWHDPTPGTDRRHPGLLPGRGIGFLFGRDSIGPLRARDSIGRRLVACRLRRDCEFLGLVVRLN